MTAGLRWVAAGALIASTASSASAYCMPPPPKTCSLYFSSDAVFVAKVVKYGHTDDWEYERYDLQVSRILKGSVGRSTTVFTGNNTGRVNWGLGESYVVFARRTNGRLVAGDGCGDQSDPSRKDRFLREIAELKRSTSASIEGRVVREWDSGDGFEGFSIRVAGPSRQYTTKSGRDGYFNIRVPAGRYRVVIDPRSVAPGGNVNRVDLVAGQCAQFEFRAPEASR